jgi:hypothetical protein
MEPVSRSASLRATGVTQMNRSILFGMCVVAGLLFNAGRANAQHMKVKMSMGHGFHPFHHGHKMKYFGPAPIGGFSGFVVQPTFVQPGVAASGMPLRDILELIRAGRDTFSRPTPDVTSRLTEIDAKISNLSARVDQLATRVVALESKTEENRRTRILVEQHDEALRLLWQKNGMLRP